MILDLHPVNPESRLVARVVAALEAGGVIAYPTDSVYALGCDAMNNRAVERLHWLTKTDKHKPFSLVCRDLAEVSSYARVSNAAFRIMRHHMPGPYVFLLEAGRAVPKLLTDKRKHIGVRVPSNPAARDIVTGLGRPLLSASVKDDDGEFIVDAEAIDKALGKNLAMVVRSGEVGREPSSVISLVTDEPEIVRAGKGDVGYFE